MMCDPKKKSKRKSFLKETNLGKVIFFEKIIVLGTKLGCQSEEKETMKRRKNQFLLMCIRRDNVINLPIHIKYKPQML